MFNKYLLPLVAVGGLSFAVFYTVVQARQSTEQVTPIIPPPSRPPTKVKVIAGAGLIEAQKENIPIGTNVPGVVWEVFIKKGDYVKKGDPLFRIDERDLRSQLKVREAELAASQAQLHKLRAAPRPEDVPPLQAAFDESKARLADAEAAVARTEKLYNRQMIAASDYDKDRFTFYAAKSTAAKAKADLERLLAGTWKEDLDVAAASVSQAQSQVESIKIELDRLTVRALADGRVLQLNVRLGQFAAMTWKEPMVVLGDVDRLHVRVDIDENDLPYFEKSADAVATLKGRPLVRFPLTFMYVEPYVIPKQSLTGSNSERVDTRVLQVVYALPDDRPVDLYVGEQMDVYLKAATTPQGISLEAGPDASLPFDDIPQPALSKPTSKKTKTSR
ncbi:HlyD family secretion protein [Singulisphaera acidiphila]|uniref:Multidrug resistance efflux pump n=1 Tax=Singulisphaera acidiphila (strain ATCC BAA-1392 / DSM 18658 / VKM B-2454 / MOB10) TaxID=886293 RepID=L0DDH7_SINAD|nr:biotin/lipoyl-binding protein [Singulisphaera acidiphila]AGA27312.1 multidrug resistance efflux pump [Singulisphaera acidiphila DSM 18658]